MQYKITNEQPFQVLCSSFSISPSQQNYTLNISADGRNYSPLFTVASGQTRLVTGVASGSYYKLVGNQSEVTVNWVRSCNDGGGGSGSGSTYTAGEYISIAEDVISVTGITPDLYLTTADTQDFATEAYVDAAITSATQDFATQADITAATSPIEEHLDDVEYVTATALTELHDAILEISGSTGSGPIIPAITSQTDYEAISGDVQTGDLIQVYGVDINDDGGDAYGLFQAEVDQGSIVWVRKDNADSLMRADAVYPWMTDNDVWPVDFGEGSFLISTDDTAEEEAYNGIGFDADGKPVITHIVPEYDEQTGEVTGITREDGAILTDDGSIVRYDINREAELANAGYNTKLITQEYDENEGATLPTIVGYSEEGILNGVKIDGHSIAKVSGYIHQQSEPTPGPVFEFTQNDELATQAYVTAATANLMTSAATQVMIDEATSGITADLEDMMEAKEQVIATALVDLDQRKVESQDVHTIVKLTQAEYDLIASPDPKTFYIIKNNQ